MHDGIELEKQGVPTAVIITDEFVNQAKAIAEIQGIPDYPFAVIPHPIGRLTPEDLKERAKLALPQVLKILGQE
ncbi:MAG: hypothetical protein IH860_01060 [Chloroflexi bacterium]|nr:hypothetical protein [Chloroflexota bacterium]MCH8088257.1 hypothetical protein [Chloroflexota bacterium]MCH9035893.1 hypothetical protein [Chloroflexota bacterium]